jgi:hypothetical protein
MDATDTGAATAGAETPPPGARPSDPAAVRRDREGRLWLGLILIGLGAIFLLDRLVPDIGGYVPLIVGLGLFVAFLATRAYGFLIPAGIVSGVGAGILLQQTYDQGGIFLLALGAGFASIWLIGSLFRLRENHWWPLIPGGILATIGLVDLADESGQLADVLDIGWPVLLVVVGLLVIIRALAQRRAGQP